MLVVETIAQIRRADFQDRKPIKQICRELRVPRNTVRKGIRSGATELTRECSVQPQPKIGPWRDELDRMLAENARKPKRERLTRIRMFDELQTRVNHSRFKTRARGPAPRWPDPAALRDGYAASGHLPTPEGAILDAERGSVFGAD